MNLPYSHWESKFLGKELWEDVKEWTNKFLSKEEFSNVVTWGLNSSLLDELGEYELIIPVEYRTNTYGGEEEIRLRKWLLENKDSLKNSLKEEEIENFEEFINELEKYWGQYYCAVDEETAILVQQSFISHGVMCAREKNRFWFPLEYEGIRILSIEEFEDDVYDLTVPDGERYLADSISVHN